MIPFIKKHRRIIFIILMAALFLLLKASPLMAQVPEDNILDGIVTKYRDAVGPWRTVLASYTERLFWMLVTIDFTWTGIELLQRKADFSEVMAEIMRCVMIIGFYLMLIQHSDTWNQAIIDSFRKAASDANAAITGKNMGVNPSDIFDAGIEIALRMTKASAYSSVGLMVATAIAALFIVAIFAVITGQVVIALVEMYIALGASVILLGFGGSRWTRDFATNQLRYVVSVGVKLFGLQLIVGIGGLFVTTWFETYAQSWSQVIVLLGASIILAMLTTTIPAIMQGLISGASAGGIGGQMIGSAKGMAAQAAGIGMAAGALGAGVASAGVEAYRGTSPDQGAMSRFGSAAGSFGKAATSDAFARFAGYPTHQHGKMGGRMASDLRAQRLAMDSDTGKAQQGSPEGPGFTHQPHDPGPAPNPMPMNGPGFEEGSSAIIPDGPRFEFEKAATIPDGSRLLQERPSAPATPLDQPKGWNPNGITVLATTDKELKP